LALFAIVVVRMPPGYRAQAIVRALESQPAKEYVAPSVMEQYGERLKTLRLAVMARPILSAVAREMKLATLLDRPEEEIVDGMRARTEVKLEGEDTWIITYEDRDPARARAVVDRMAALFIDGEVKRREEKASATVHAIAGEVDALRPQMAHLDAQVRDFKFAHNGSLPEQLEANLRALDQATMEVNIQSTNLDGERDHRRALLAAIVSPLRHQEDQLETALHDARTHYVPDHPEVRRIGAELAELKKLRIDDEADLRKKQLESNPELMALEDQIRRSEANLGALRQRQVEVRQRVAETAPNGQELARLSTEYEAIRVRYQGAIGKLHEAELAQALEQRLSGQRFALVEGAALPRIAAHPNRPMWSIGALLLAIALGLAAGFAIDLRDPTVRGADELAAMVAPLPVLASVPPIDVPAGSPLGPQGGVR
jgi:uncharacterized protein involved in exopolysaccharide biosynthesis